MSMSNGEKPEVEYRALKSISEIHPDNPRHPMWEQSGMRSRLEAVEGEELIERKVKLWFRELKNQFESFQHHRNSSLFVDYGHEYGAGGRARTMDLKEIVPGEYSGGMDYRWWASLEGSLRHRLLNYGTSSGGWSVFDRIKGDYEISIIDESVLKFREETLEKFMDIINGDTKLTTIDPITNEKAITLVDPKLKKMEGIKYDFPFGMADTTILHYMVMEPIMEDEKGEIEPDIIKLAQYFGCKDIINHEETTSGGRVVGRIVGVRDDLKKGGKELFSKIQPVIDELNESFKEGGVEAINDILISLGDIKTEKIKGAIKEGPLEEVYKSISPKALIRKASPVLADILNNLRPPDKDDKGGSNWPKTKGGTYYIWITNDAFQVLTKTTGREWGTKTKSCENWDGQYKQGPASDIKYGNCMIYIYEGGKRDISLPLKNQIGRMSLRWGDSYIDQKKGEWDVGLEDQTYPKNANWGLNMATAIVKILKDHGLMNYEYCMTPYEFEGYSDYVGRRGQITYERPTMKKGGEIQIDEYDFISTARNPTISHQRVGWILTHGTEVTGLYTALAQNPALWIYPNPMKRFLKNIRGHRDVTTILPLLIDSDLADFNLFNYVLEHTEDYDPTFREYDMSIINLILNHPNCTSEIHRRIQIEFPGYLTQRPPFQFIGGIDEIVYLNLMSRTNQYDIMCPPHICNAPEDILDKLTNKVLTGRLPGWSMRKREYIAPLPISHATDYDTSDVDIEFFWRHHEYLCSIRNLIFAPSLSHHAFLKLLESFTKFYQSLPSNYETKYPQSAKLIQRTIDDFINCICLPLRESDDYGYMNELNGRFIGLGEVNVKYRYHLEDRQSAESVKMLYKLAPHVFNYEENGLLVSNIRVHSVYSLLWKMVQKEKWDISPFVFLNKYVDRKNHDKPGNYTFVNGEQFISSVKSLDSELLPLLVYDFKPYHIEEGATERTSVPKGVIPALISDRELMYIIGVNWVARWIEDEDDFYAFEDEIVEMIGPIIGNKEGDWEVSDFIAWATGGGDTHILSQAACGGSSLEGGLVENPALPIDLLERMVFPPTIVDYGDRKWSIIDNQYEGDYTEFLHPVLGKLIGIESTSGEILEWISKNYPSHIDQIATNPKAPSNVLNELINKNPLGLLKNKGIGPALLTQTIDLVMELLRLHPPSDPERFYDRCFKEGRVMGPVLTKIKTVYECSVCGWEPSMDRYSSDDDKAFEVAAHIEQSISGSDDYGYMDHEGATVVSNEEESKYRTKEWVSVPSMTENILSGHEDVRTLLTETLNQDLVRGGDWIRYWRGGNSHKQMILGPNTTNLNTLKTSDGSRPSPIVSFPILIEKPQVIVDIDYWGAAGDRLRERHGWGAKSIGPLPSQVQIRYIDIIEILDNGKIQVKGRKKMVSPENRGRWSSFQQIYQDTNEMYGVKEPERWICSECSRIFDNYKEGNTHIVSHIEGYYAKGVRRGTAELKIHKSTLWKHDVTIVLADERKYNRLPEWRLKWGKSEQEQFYESICSNPQTTDDILLHLINLVSEYQGHAITSPERHSENRRAIIKLPMLLNIIDRTKRWSQGIINSEFMLRKLLGVNSPSFIGNYENAKPTSKIFEICIESNEYNLSKYALNMDLIAHVQLWVLNSYGLEVPISFIYQMLTLPYIRRDVKDRAQSRYRSRQVEFVEYLSSLHEVVEGGVMPND